MLADVSVHMTGQVEKKVFLSKRFTQKIKLLLKCFYSFIQTAHKKSVKLL